MTASIFFVDQPPDVLEKFRGWLSDTPMQCISVEPINRAFSLVVRDNPWAVVLSIETDIGLRLCQQIREDDLLDGVKVIALSTGASSHDLTKHMFGDSSADVYGKVPLEDGIVDVWLQKQLASLSDSSSTSAQTDSELPVMIEMDEVLLEDTISPSKSSHSTKRMTTSNTEDVERVSRLELELFEQSEKLTATSRKLLKNQLALQELEAHNGVLEAECERLSTMLANGATDQTLKQELKRMYERLQMAEQAIEQMQQQHTELNLEAVDTLSTQDLLRQITLLRQVRDEKVDQINALHGELQLTRQAVDALQQRTSKAESRLTEVQDLSQLREQQMQQEFLALQRQVSNSTRNLEIAQHREQQMTEQTEQLQSRIQELDTLYQQERTHWLKKSAELEGAGQNFSEKEQALLAEIDGLTQALQAQLMGDDAVSVERTVVASLEHRLETVQAEFAKAQTKIEALEIDNTQLSQQLREQQTQEDGLSSAQMLRQQQLLDSTLKALEESLTRQDALEQQLLEQNELLQTARTQTSTEPIETVSAEMLATSQRQNEELQAQLAEAWDEVLQLKQQLATQSQMSTTQPSPTGRGTEQETLQRLQEIMLQITKERDALSLELVGVRTDIHTLEQEKENLLRALEDSQSMADAVEEATDTELAEKQQTVVALQEALEDRTASYQELELQTAMVISERDDMWSKLEPLEKLQVQLQQELDSLQEAYVASQQELDAERATLEEVTNAHDNLQTEVQRLTERQVVLDETVQTLKAENEQAQEVAQRHEALESENQALSEQRQQLLSEQALLKTQVSGLEDNIQTLEHSLETQQSEYSGLAEQLETVKAELEEHQQVLIEKDALIESLQSDISSLSAQSTELEHNIEQLQTEIVTLQEEFATGQDEIVMLREAHTEEKHQYDQTIAEQQATIAQLHQQSDETTQQFAEQIETLESQMNVDRERLQMVETEQISVLEEQLATNRLDLQEKIQLVQDLEERIEILEAETQQMHRVEQQLREAQQRSGELEAGLQQIRTEWADAESAWEMERQILESTHQEDRLALEAVRTELETIQQDNETLTSIPPVDTTRFDALSQELATITEQRAELLDTIDQLIRKQDHTEQSLRELQGNSEDLVLRLQEERDEAHTELEMMKLEMGIAQSTARQLAQQAERMRKKVLAKQASWQQRLTDKESENDRLRAKLQSMEQGLSSLFVKRPIF